ncbi:MAG: Coq4 family protein [Pseudomonadota bacterium]
MSAEIYLHPDRKAPRLKPFTAMTRMRKLIANKEDTEQVFHIIEALNGRNLLNLLEKFAASEKGAQRLAERRYLPPLLDDHSWIEALPEDSVGQAYLRFMRREGLSAQGLVEESDKFYGDDHDDTLRWFGNRLRDTHDLFHVLSGYGRDALGEASLLGFTWGQHGGRGVIFISFMGTRQIRKALPKHIDVMACHHEGKRNGKAAASIIEEDIIALMHEPLAEARARLNIAKPVAYQRAIAQISELGNAQELLAAA